MNVLVTGITGRIGAELAAELASSGHSVRGLVWPQDPGVEKLSGMDLELIRGGLTDRDDVTRAVNGVEVVFHLGAAFQAGGPFSEQDFFDINVGGTFNVLEAARARGTVPHLIFASTDALYHKYVPGGMEEPITERAPRVATGPYAMSKAVAEELCMGYWHSYSLPLTILRFASVFAADEILQFPQFYLSELYAGNPALERLWQGEERLVALKDDRGRFYKKHVSDVRDIVQGCVRAMGRERAFGEVFQLAGPKPFTWDEAVYRLSEILQIPVIEAAPGGIPTFYEFDLSKSKRYLGFQPQYDVVQMIVDALSFRRENESAAESGDSSNAESLEVRA